MEMELCQWDLHAAADGLGIRYSGIDEVPYYGRARSVACRTFCQLEWENVNRHAMCNTRPRRLHLYI